MSCFAFSLDTFRLVINFWLKYNNSNSKMTQSKLEIFLLLLFAVVVVVVANANETNGREILVNKKRLVDRYRSHTFRS